MSLSGLKPLLSLHWKTLTSLRLKHVEFGLRGPHARPSRRAEIFSAFALLKGLKDLGLTGVEGFRAADWIDLFVSPGAAREANGVGVVASGPLDRNGNRSPSRETEVATFPELETLELDFVPDVVLYRLGEAYGERLKTLGISEHILMFDGGDEGNIKKDGRF